MKPEPLRESATLRLPVPTDVLPVCSRDKEMEKTFEVVKHRNRGREESTGASVQQLQLDNQYAILGDK